MAEEEVSNWSLFSDKGMGAWFALPGRAIATTSETQEMAEEGMYIM